MLQLKLHEYSFSFDHSFLLEKKLYYTGVTNGVSLGE